MAAPTGSFGPYPLASGSRFESKSPSRLFNKTVAVASGSDFWATGSAWGAVGFFTTTATAGSIFSWSGGEISASNVAAGTIYELGIRRVSGSDATTYLLYP